MQTDGLYTGDLASLCIASSGASDMNLRVIPQAIGLVKQTQTGEAACYSHAS